MQKSLEVELRPATADVLMTDANLIVEAQPAVEQPEEEPIKPFITVPSAFEMIHHLADIDREYSQLLLPHTTVEFVVPLAVATVDKLVWEEPIQQELTSDEA